MKSILRILAVALIAALATPSFAETKRENLVVQVESCEAILQEFMASPKTAIPASVLREAKGIVIVNQFQVGFVFGGKGGYGVVMARKPDGRWSVPAFLDTGEASFGLQLGGRALNTIYILNDEAGVRLLYKPKFNFGVNANAVAGPRVAEVQEATQIIKAPIYVYQKSSGLYAGAKVKSGWLAPHNSANSLFYNTTYTMPEILFSDWIAPQPDVVPLMNLVTKLTQ
ncbi:MAG TPA: lipid-binding SYLF domain-containing protein [Opitutaceae bacterium]|nr:lipid-binding SYLF domain-containing protein [Opitutaceae bacterium]